MKITNKFNLPQALVNAVSADIRKPEPMRISCTELIDSPQIRILKMRHWDEIEQDVSELLWALLGRAVHSILEQSAHENCLVEETLTAVMDGWTVTGRPDLLDANGILHDWKVTSVYSFLLSEKQTWNNQVNVYANLYQRHGFEVKEAYINAILRDWHKSRGGDYPERPFYEKKVELLDNVLVTDYIRGRLNLHWQAEHHGELDDCTTEERWARCDTWAVMKKGKKRADRVFNTEKDCNRYLENALLGGQTYTIQHRPGENIRCEKYCVVKQFCNQYVEIKKG